MSREPRYIDRRLFLTGSAIALLAAACGSDGGASNPLSGATATTVAPPTTTSPPASTSPPTTAKPVGPAEFLAQVRDEGRKVTWPTRKETVVTTVMVFIMVVVASIFFTVVDQALRYLVTLILGVGA